MADQVRRFCTDYSGPLRGENVAAYENMLDLAHDRDDESP